MRSVPLAATLSIAVLGGCSLHSVDTDPKPPVALPASYDAAGGAAPIAGPWWRGLGDPALPGLVERALTGNLDLRQVWARLDQAKAIAGIAGAGKWPTLDAEARAGRGRDAFGVTDNTFSWSAAATYELDLWKRVASTSNAAVLDAAAARDDAEAAAMTITAYVAETWYDVVYARASSKLVGEQVATNETLLALVQARFEQNIVSAVDVYQQQQRLLQVQAQLDLIEARRRTSEHRLAELLGEAPGTLRAPAGDALPELPPFPDAGVPADLLTRRPDVRAARRRLVAADYRVAAAVADRLPSIRLTASAGKSATDVSDLGSSPVWNLAAGILAPLFDGGRRAREVDRNEAVVDERRAQYGAVLLSSMREVGDAAVLEQQQRLYIADIEKAFEAANGSLAEARERYREGVTDYLPVLTAVTAAQQLESDVLAARRQLVSYRVQLYRALGGDWTRELSKGDSK